MTHTLYACPVCQAELTHAGNQLTCPSGHSFDRHKKGYVNLLLAQQKKSRTPGDDVGMVESRRRFLRQGHYAPLADCLTTLCRRLLPTEAQIWDAGCGEGYYTARLAEAMPEATLHGLDISKPAIQAASQYKNIEWCVASSAHPPYQSAVFDGIVSVFSRIDSAPFARVLKPGGQVFVAAPDHDHLQTLRSLIYDQVRPYNTEKHLTYLDQRFSLAEQQRLEIPLHLSDQQAIQDLLGMTPHAHRRSRTVDETLKALSHLNDTACFKIYRFSYECPSARTITS